MGQKELEEVSKIMNVKKIEIQNMESRLTNGDVFLNQTINDDGDDLMSFMPDEKPNPQAITETYFDNKSKKNWLLEAIETLNEREKTIIKTRKLKEKSLTLEELGKKLKISKERVRQIETNALIKLKKVILHISQQEKEFFI